jgi:hypothetical protein
MDDDDLDGTPEPEPYDPTLGMRHLAAAILLQAVQDSRFWNPHVRRDALLFLLPREDRFREHLQLILVLSRVNQTAFRRWMSQFF